MIAAARQLSAWRDVRDRRRRLRLVAPDSRARLAARLERVVAAVDGSPRPLRGAGALHHRAVCDARHELMRLAGELRHMPHPCAKGVAMAERLLTDPSSPLYTAPSGNELARAAREAANSMRLNTARR